MFREMRRAKQALSQEECIRLLKEEKRGVISVIGDEGYPYGTPINHFYNEEDGKIYFHTGKIGHRVDALKACNKVSFTLHDAGYAEEGEWALHFKSVHVFGRMEVVEDYDFGMEMCRRLAHKFTPDVPYVEEEIQRAGPATLVLALTPEHISGKSITES